MKNPTISYSGRISDIKALRSLITISGDSEVIIENCRRIIECNDIKCSVSTSGYVIDVWGAELTLTSFANGNVAVCGRIQSLSIGRRSGRIGEKADRS